MPAQGGGMEIKMRRNLPCIVCPMGCSIDVTIDKDGKITEIVGNTCSRGAEYAKNECTNPTRVVTSTAMTADGRPVPVKTNRPIPKDKIFECMDIINSLNLTAPLKIGDIAAKDVFGCDIVITANIF